MKDDVGRVGYESYAKSTGGKTYDGKPMPSWDELTDRIRNAWRDAADGVIASVSSVTIDGGSGLAPEGELFTCANLSVTSETGLANGVLLIAEGGVRGLKIGARYRVSFDELLELPEPFQGEVGKGYEVGPDGVRELTDQETADLHANQPRELAP